MTDLMMQRLRAYNPPDRTVDEQRQIAQDIHDAADEIERLRRENAWQLTEIKELPRLRAEIERLTRERDALDAKVQGYYNEASEGWTTFRAAERELTALRERIAGGTRAWRNRDHGTLILYIGSVLPSQRRQWQPMLVIDDEARDG